MTDDEKAALRWLVGREDAPPQKSMPSAGRAALVRILRTSAPLGAVLRNAIANALEPIGSSEMTFMLEMKRRRGRGRPRLGARLAYAQMKLAESILAEPTPKIEAKVDDARTKARKSRSTAYSALAAKARARGKTPVKQTRKKAKGRTGK